MPKKVVFTCRDVLKGVGGEASYARAHARAAIEGGFEPHFFCASSDRGTLGTDFGIVHRVWTPFRPLRAIAVPANGPFVARALIRFLAADKQPFLIHGIGPASYGGSIAYRKLSRAGIYGTYLVSAFDTYEREAQARLAAVTSAHGKLLRLQNRIECLWTRLAVTPCERRAYAQASLVLVNYESVRQSLLQGYAESENIRVTRYSSETAFLNREEPDPAKRAATDAPLIVAVSRHDPRKGIHFLLRALAHLRAAGVPFRALLIGPGPLLALHRRMARELGLGSETRIEGRVDEPFLHLRKADIFVLPSLEEGSASVSMIEAMQCGVAVVATDVDGIPEDVVHEDSALLVAPGDVAELTHALQRLLTDQPLRERLARRAREEFERRFSPDAFQNSLLEIYAELGFTP
ncbi:MAG: glycosyltransferase [Acidobacteriota bacterium]